jgi:hypothetical protein
MLPPSMVILWLSVVLALEMVQCFASFGSKVWRWCSVQKWWQFNVRNDCLKLREVTRKLSSYFRQCWGMRKLPFYQA